MTAPRPTPSILWFRRDLRLADNPALRAAAASGAVVPVFIWSPSDEAPWAPGAASRWWLHHSLEALDAGLRKAGSRLVVRRGPAATALRSLLRETGARAVSWNRLPDPSILRRDEQIEEQLGEDGVRVDIHNGALLFEPDAVRSGEGKPLKVFTAFWRRCLEQRPPTPPLPPPQRILPPSRWPGSVPVGNLGLLPRVDWAGGLGGAWTPGEAGAAGRLRRFVRSRLADYQRGRDVPAEEGTSRLSPHLHFGEISPGQVWHAAGASGAGAEAFRRELGWREFAHYLLHHFPFTTGAPLDGRFRAFRWSGTPAQLKAWQHGQTGYPIVDAGMRELWATGWMHNRVRMIVASFLVKDLLVSWQEGARWFWDTLVDADLANNTLGWQWTAGCGADAAPFFRVFNPALQGGKFDREGSYVRRWLPELAALPARWIHRPSDAPADVLAANGVRLGRDYPRPLVDHAAARKKALAVFGKLSR